MRRGLPWHMRTRVPFTSRRISPGRRPSQRRHVSAVFRNVYRYESRAKRLSRGSVYPHWQSSRPSAIESS